jgi:GNAT superfamily N-acetyltransferase
MELPLRPLTPDDIPACVEVFYTASEELYTRRGQPLSPRNPPSLMRLFTHLQASDPGRAWVAEHQTQDGAEVAAFGLAYERDWLRFLSFLFVLPEEQAGGVGRALFERCMGELDGDGSARRAGDDAGERDRVLATCVDAIQPVSTALYSRKGLVPRVPIFTLIGAPTRGELPSLPSSVQAIAFEEVVEREGHQALSAAVQAVDAAVLGYQRVVDHVTWRREERRGTLLRAAGSGAPLGYGYAQASGRLGPIAVLDPELLTGTLAEGMRLPINGDGWQAVVPGPAERALVPLLDAGLRIEGSPGLCCSTDPLASWERYLCAGYALL